MKTRTLIEHMRRCWRPYGLAVAGIDFMLPGAPALAGPPTPHVAAGSAQVSRVGKQTLVRQTSQNAIIDWNSFSIRAGESMNFAQPSSGSAVLNRVTGNDPSQLYGTLHANGRVFLVNRNGVVVGPNGVIDTAAFAASTLDMADKDFMDGGTLKLAGDSKAGVVNLGTIKAAGGNVLLVGRTVSNLGRIEAPEGRATLAAGTQVLFVPDSGSAIVVNPGGEGTTLPVGVDQQGVIEAAQAELEAAGGSAYELAVNQTGTIRATGIASRRPYFADGRKS